MILAVPRPSYGQAQAPPQTQGSSRLASVQVTGSARFPSDRIAAAAGLRVGSDVSRDDLQKAANDLAQLGFFSDIEYRYSTTTEGVRAEYQVKDAPVVPVSFDNFPWFTDAELSAAIKSSVPLFDGAAPEHGAALDAMSQALGVFLSSHGMNLTVSHSLLTEPASDQRVQLFRVEDSNVRISAVEFSDPLAQTDRGIQMRLPDIVGQPYSRAAVELFEFEQVRPVYVSHAFLRVQLGVPSARVSGNSVTVVAPIEPGAAFTWGGVTWKGNSVISMLDLAALVPLHEGETADGMKIERGWDLVRSSYMQRGYLDITLDLQPHFDDAAKRISYAVSVTEGPQYRMGKLVLTGLSIEGERRIRSGWRIAPGAVFDNDVYQAFVTDGVRQAFAGLPFHYDKIGRFLQKDPAAMTVDVMLDFQ